MIHVVLSDLWLLKEISILQLLCYHLFVESKKYTGEYNKKSNRLTN